MPHTDSSDWLDGALAKGLGRAILRMTPTLARSHQASLLQACVRNLCYDPDVEGDRAEWMLHVLDAGNAVDALCEPAFALMLTDVHEPRDMQQSCRLAALLVQRGNEGGRAILDHFLDPQHSKAESSVAYEPILQLENEAGLERMMRNRGQLIGAGAEETFWELSGIAEGVFGEERAASLFAKIAAQDADAQRWLDACQKTFAEARASQEAFAQREADPRWRGISGNELLQRVREAGLHAPRSWSAEATPEDLQVVARGILDARSDAMRLLLWQAIGKRRYQTPELLPMLLEMVHHPHAQTRRQALLALRSYQHRSIRRLAEERMRDHQADALTVGLLVRNYEAADLHVLEQMLDHFDTGDPDETHELHHSIAEVCLEHPHADALRMLSKIYESEQSAFTRCIVMQAMIKGGNVPQELAEECKHDAFADTRALF